MYLSKTAKCPHC